MALTARGALDALDAYLITQPGIGTLQDLQRAVLRKGEGMLERAGHWPILDFPLAIHRALEGEVADGYATAGACALFYAFADVVDDAQDHDLRADPWAKWGWEQAVNTGSSLLFLALQSLHDRLSPRSVAPAVEVFVRAGLEMTHGQHVDLLGQAMKEPTLEAYMQAIERKSGASFGAYAQVVAIANGLVASESLRHRDFGRLLGMMFQMMNDVHELWSGTLCPDFVNARLSFPFVLALEQLSGGPRDAFMRLLAGPKDLDHQLRLVQSLEEAGIKAYATMRIEVMRRKARDAARALKLDHEPYLAAMLATPAFPEQPVAI